MATAADIKGAVTRWWWVRHAVVPNPEGRCYGQNDMDCDVSDHALFRHQAALLPRGAVWVTSGLLRAIKTAETLRAHGADWREPEREPRFNEQHFGAWQGLTYADIAANHGDNHLFWLGPPTNRPPGGESFVDLMARAGEAGLAINARHKGRDIVAVPHGGTLRAARAGDAARRRRCCALRGGERLADPDRALRTGRSGRTPGASSSPICCARRRRGMTAVRASRLCWAARAQTATPLHCWAAHSSPPPRPAMPRWPSASRRIVPSAARPGRRSRSRSISRRCWRHAH